MTFILTISILRPSGPGDGDQSALINKPTLIISNWFICLNLKGDLYHDLLQIESSRGLAWSGSIGFASDNCFREAVLIVFGLKNFFLALVSFLHCAYLECD